MPIQICRTFAEIRATVGAWRSQGARTVFVLTGHGEEERPAAEPFADHVVSDLAAAVDVIRGAVLAEAET